MNMLKARVKDEVMARAGDPRRAAGGGGEGLGSEAREVEEFARVRLVTDKYEGLGLRLGEVGSVVHVHTKPRLGYAVEFHDVSADNSNKVKSFGPEDIELV